jgi:hypothetical protein
MFFNLILAEWFRVVCMHTWKIIIVVMSLELGACSWHELTIEISKKLCAKYKGAN